MVTINSYGRARMCQFVFICGKKIWSSYRHSKKINLRTPFITGPNRMNNTSKYPAYLSSLDLICCLGVTCYNLHHRNVHCWPQFKCIWLRMGWHSVYIRRALFASRPTMEQCLAVLCRLQRRYLMSRFETLPWGKLSM